MLFLSVISKAFISEAFIPFKHFKESVYLLRKFEEKKLP